MADFRVIGHAGETHTAKALATIAVGDALKYGANGVTPAGDGDQVDGFAATAGSTGSYVTVLRGSMRVIGSAATGVNFAVGDQVYLDASGKLDTGSIGNVSLGTVVGTDPETAGFVEFLFDPLASFTQS